ncbi:outer membrane lipoprotein carrier protein LolA [Virgibacillus halophilus]|uniref:LolA family protein n=1 Tax=Tigheibacillus halophilus TaxID=361280 RepID=UPI003627ED15
MMKKMTLWLVLAVGMVLLLSACGEKSQEDVMKKMENKMNDMSGYKAKAKMSMKTGQEDQTYSIDIWHKKKDFYRVSLDSDQDKKSNQIILKNNDGVYVLTPSLNKSFKFQTEWPDNSSQPYLFQSLVKDIKKDKDATFKATDKHYVFQTKTNYQSNNNLPFQEIYIDKKTYTPVMVKVLDKDKKSLVEVKFQNFDLDPSFKKKDFVLKDIMTSAVAELPVSKNQDNETDSLTVFFPEFTAGAELAEKQEINLADGKRVIMSYTGEKGFTLIQEKKASQETMSYPKQVDGELVNLGKSIGALSDKSLEWTENGTNYILASEQLTKEELIQVAESVAGKEVK